MPDWFYYCFPEVPIYLPNQPSLKYWYLLNVMDKHEGFVVAALDWLKTYSAEKNFEITVINHATEINETMLAKYKVFIQFELSALYLE